MRDDTNRWHPLPTADEWAELSRITRTLVGMTDGRARTQLLESLARTQPVLRRRLGETVDRLRSS